MRRLLFKLLLKISVSVIALFGVLSYGYYLQGGDPGAVAAKLGRGLFGGIGDRVVAVAGGARDGVTDAKLRIGAGSGASPDGVEIFTWRDAEGVTHYSNEAPPDLAGADALRTVTVRPDTNVLVPVGAPALPPATSPTAGPAADGGLRRTLDSRPVSHGDAFDAPGTGRDAGTLPGIAGLVGGAPGEAAVSPAEAAALLRLLRGGSDHPR